MGLVLINQASAAESIKELAENTTLPILQDTTEQSAATGYGAEKWYIYLIGSDQRLKHLHYALDLDDERDRLLTEISDVLAGKSPAAPPSSCEGTP